MKAKEYFERYVNENQDKGCYERVAIALVGMFIETNAIVEARKARSDSALIAIFKEQNRKANSFIKKVNEIEGLNIESGAFKRFVSGEMPDLAKVMGWMD